MKLPNFFLVGVPKSGTTSLYAYLGQHPQIYMSPTEEPGYFGPELWPQNFEVLSWEDYLGLFRDVSDETRLWPYLRKLAPRPFGPRLQPLLLRPRASIAMAPADRAYLTDYYREAIRHLEALLDRDLSAWLNAGAAGQPRGARPGAGR